MNKISKKIVALATMAAFVLTLVPAAAFAAPTDFSKTQSEVKVVTPAGQTEGSVSVKANENLTLQMELNNVSGGKYTEDTDVVNRGYADQNTIQVWAVEKGATTITDALEVTGYKFNGETEFTNTGDKAATNTDFQVQVAFYRSGDYTIYAGLGADVETAAESGNAFKVASVDNNTVNVYSDPAAAVSKVDFTSAIGSESNNTSVEAGKTNATVSYADVLDKIPANGIAYDTITVNANDETNNDVIGADFTVKANKAGVTVDKSSVTTDRDGNISVKVYFTKAGDYKLYFTNNGKTYTLNLNRAEAAQPETIETTVDNGQTLLAGNDTANNTGVVYNDADFFANAVQFNIIDENGDVMAKDLTGTEDVFTKGSLYLSLDQKPQGSALLASDLKLVWNVAKKVYTLQYEDTNAATDLIPGEYKVTVALESGDKATASFTLAKFGEPTDLRIELTGDKTGTLDDTVVAGEKVTGKVYNVDENGIEIEASVDDYYTQVTGAAENVTYLTFTASSDEEDLGSTIVARAFNFQTGKLATKELTIVDGKSTNTLAFDSENGEANADNTVKVSVVDENGDVVKSVNGPMYASVVGQSDEDANIEVTPGTVSNGKGNLTIFSDKETSVDIVVTVIDDVDTTNRVIYAGTLEYTIGAEDINAENTVVMTIGSTDYVVNNDIVAGDAAPYVDSAWRTMVPFRVLGETFGATVNWDQDAQTVTYTYGDTELTMTIGEETYTVNGDEKTMDTAPVLSGDRTFVPVRFVAEALGYTVTPLQDANGLTASVVFQK